MCDVLGLIAAVAFTAPVLAGEKKDIVDTAVGAGSFKHWPPRSRPPTW